jgi:antirestriction protein ArdC
VVTLLPSRKVALSEQARIFLPAGRIFPRNFHTGKPYRGVNVVLLWGTEYTSPFWLTFKQAHELGGSVRKGQLSERIVFYKQLPKREYATSTEENENASKRSRAC